MILAAALLAVTVFLLTEATLRISRFGPSAAAFGRWQKPPEWHAIRSLDPDGSPRPIPDGRGRWALHAWNAPVDYRLDERGFRIRASGAGTILLHACRVLAVGDSNAFGYGVAADDAYPAQLEGLLATRGISASVENAGIAGSDVGRQHRWLEAILPRSDVELVLLTVSPWSLRLDPGPTGYEGNRFRDKLWRVIDARMRRLWPYSAVVERACRRGVHALSGLLGWPPPSGVAWEMDPLIEPPAAFDRRWAEVAGEIDRMVQLVRGRRAEPLLVFVPLDVQVSRTRNRLYREERLPYASYGFDDRDYTVSNERYAAAIAELAARVHIQAIDVTGALRRDVGDAFLPDDYHLGPGGHRRVAALVAPAVADHCARSAVLGQHGRAKVRERTLTREPVHAVQPSK